MKFLQWTTRRSLHVVAVVSALSLLAVGCLLLTNLNQQRRARELIETVRRFQPGQTRAKDVVRLARGFDFDTEVVVWIDEPTSSRIRSERLIECETTACSIDIALLLPGQYVSTNWFPRRSETLRRYLPQKMVFARVGVKNGVVTRVSVLLESHDDRPYEAAGVTYSSERAATAQSSLGWSISRTSGIFTGGLWGGSYNSLNVEADESIPLDRVGRVSEFNVKCLSLWSHCSACEMMKTACQESKPGPDKTLLSASPSGG